MREKCLIDDCERTEDRRGFCNKHYRRYLKYGDAEITPYERASAKQIEQMISAALLSDTYECIIWPYGKDSDGYGWCLLDGKQSAVHRWICAQEHGQPIGDRDQAAHFCGNPSCINRRHLRWATKSENMMDKHIHLTMSSRGRMKLC